MNCLPARILPERSYKRKKPALAGSLLPFFGLRLEVREERHVASALDGERELALAFRLHA